MTLDEFETTLDKLEMRGLDEIASLIRMGNLAGAIALLALEYADHERDLHNVGTRD